MKIIYPVYLNQKLCHYAISLLFRYLEETNHLLYRAYAHKKRAITHIQHIVLSIIFAKTCATWKTKEKYLL